ncbi:PPC domain-containing DNA-binding protein [Anaeromicrobium sediminis]|uniref:DNA-binding protein n=1 Tax=Anaeromicrobium sediminis TaxID=1478221 RepID=A0A267MHV9_9FIRM|nr:PPC domain-containing DNA-binding protein [Anaeromicrobium sediminis]PAB58455.1 DNA-binding protein [Anaeromicrobium sediminis]
MKCVKRGSKYFVRIDKGQEVVSSLKNFCEENNVKLGSVVGIGATDKVTIGLFNTDTKEYHNKELVGEYEITNLTGNISTKEEEVYLHLHITLGDEEYKAFGGHLNECWISGTCELVVDVIDGQIERIFDDYCGLNVLKID